MTESPVLHNSIVVRLIRYLTVACGESLIARWWRAADSFFVAAARDSRLVGMFYWDLHEEAAWRSSIPGRSLRWLWSTLEGTAITVSDVINNAWDNSVIIRLSRRLLGLLNVSFGGSHLVAFAKSITGIRDLGAPSAGGALLTGVAFLMAFLPTTLNTLVAFGLVLVWALAKVARRDFQVSFHRSYVPAFLLFAAAVATTIGSSTIRGSLPSLILWASYAALFFVASQWVEKPADLLWVSLAWVASAMLISLLGFQQYLSGAETAASWVDVRVAEDIKTRVYSVFDNPNMLAEYLTYVVAICAALLLAARSNFERLGYAAGAGIAGLCLVVTYSRGGWVATAFAVAIIGLIKDRRVLLVMLAMALVAPVFLPDALLSRAATLVTFDDSSAMYRITIWKAVLRMIRDRWATGVGLGSQAFSKIYPQYEIAGTPAAHSHNLYLQIVAEMGIVALLLFFWTMANHLRDAVSAKSSVLRGRAGFIVVALVAGTLGQLLHGLIDNVWYSPKNVMFFWLAVGLATGARSIKDVSSEGAPS